MTDRKAPRQQPPSARIGAPSAHPFSEKNIMSKAAKRSPRKANSAAQNPQRLVGKGMKVEFRSLAQITPYEKNPRINDPAVDGVAASIKQFGFRQPIVVDADGVIVVGHTRWKAAKQLGLKRVPVHVAADLTPEQAKAYRIADNQTASVAEWEMNQLLREILELTEAKFDLSLLGFDSDQLEKILKTGNGEETCDKHIPELWQIVISCGSEREQKTLYTELVKRGLRCKLLML